MTQGILFDFGGTLDTGGDHWMHILYDIIRESTAEFGSPIDPQLDKELYRRAFAYGERTLATKPIITPQSPYFDIFFEKVQLQIDYIMENSSYRHNENYTLILTGFVANRARDIAREHINRHAAILKRLKSAYKIGLVSNFYGNLDKVLIDFDIKPLFSCVIESARAGVKKPDPAIYKLGCEGLGLPPEDCLVVGDSLVKDIQPALAIGCKAFWVEGRGWDDHDQAATERLLNEFESSGRFGRIRNLDEIAGKLKDTHK